jgi:hypothetical protein
LQSREDEKEEEEGAQFGDTEEETTWKICNGLLPGL